MNTQFESIFRKGSVTFYNSSKLFPEKTREEVMRLYGFVRTADNFVDKKEQDANGFFELRENTLRALSGNKTGNKIIDSYAELARAKGFDEQWTIDFLDAMESDLSFKGFEAFSDLEKYIYGSAETIGMMMARIMDLPQESYNYARLQGKAMQLINFIRDIKEDLELGRVYLPREDLKKFGVKNLGRPTENPLAPEELIKFELDRYFAMQKESENGYAFIPKEFLAPIKSAAEMYAWTALEIYNKPLLVFSGKVTPTQKMAENKAYASAGIEVTQ